MTEKEEFVRGLEELGEPEVRTRVRVGNRSVYQRRHMDWAKDWLEEKDKHRAEARDAIEAKERKGALDAQKQSNRLNKYIVWISVGLLLAAVAALYLGK